jgi:hypothetical protein
MAFGKGDKGIIGAVLSPCVQIIFLMLSRKRIGNFIKAQS